MDSSITSNYEVMKDVALFTKLTPHQRNLAIQKFVPNINGMCLKNSTLSKLLDKIQTNDNDIKYVSLENTEAKSVLQSWGLRLEEAAVKLEGRVLTAPQITLNSRCNFHADANCQFSDKVARNSVFDPVRTIISCFVVHFCTNFTIKVIITIK